MRKRERERQNDSWVGTERERGRHRIWSRLQAPSCHCRAHLEAQTYEPELWNHDLSWRWTLNRLSYPGAPIFFFLKNIVIGKLVPQLLTIKLCSIHRHICLRNSLSLCPYTEQVGNALVNFEVTALDVSRVSPVRMVQDSCFPSNTWCPSAEHHIIYVTAGQENGLLWE